jgi:hypothetical protein
VTAQPTNLVPDATGRQGFLVVATNMGGADTDGHITVTDVLPPNLSPAAQDHECETVGQRISCSFDEVVPPGESISIFLPVIVEVPAGTAGPNVTSIMGGGTEGVEATTETEVGASPPAYGFLDGPSGLGGLLSGSEGVPVTQAGATPFEFVMNLGFPSEMIGSELLGVGQPKDVAIDLSPGISLDPNAVPRCGEAQLERDACPPASQVGVVGLAFELTSVIFKNVPLYNLVPPPGSASNFGFVVESAVAVHLLGSVRAGEYGLSAEAANLLARFPILGMQIQLWGNPSDSSHDAARGGAVDPLGRPLMTLPSACGPLELSARTDSWEDPGSFISRSVPIQSLAGGDLEVEGCSGLAFAPTLSVQSTTAVADSPAGLQLRVEVPQQSDLEGSTTSSLRQATVDLPPGMVVNPAAAGGTAVCSPAQVGLVSGVGEPTARFDGAATTCLDASKLGVVEALTPLLQDESEEGMPRSRSLTGSIYLAQPHQNPFGSLFALYAVIEDPERGIVVKLAGEVVADPATGRLTATFDELPELPFEEFKLDFFEGPPAALRTPALCGSYLSQGAMAPWSGTAPVTTDSRFAIAASPSGGACADAPDQLPNSPRFVAGSVSPAAGRYSPFVLNLGREDGTQELSEFDAVLPVGVGAKLAGIPYCPDANLQSCPTASEVGTVSVTAGAGPTPLHIGGHVYLSGPYKNAPLSLVLVVPAVAGPFDLGTVVVRAALYVDPTTGQIRAVSDRFPTILQGVPLDLRTISIDLDRPEFIVNPTSCEPTTMTGVATSVLGKEASLSTRYQIGDCQGLAFRPDLSVRLIGPIHRGAHPTLRTVVTPRHGDANLAGVAVTLPATELLDNRHIRTVCSRAVPVDQCPRASAYGQASVWSPLLGEPLMGPVYLRASDHRLPDLVAPLDGQFHLDLTGQVSSVHGRLRTTFDSLPDLPLDRFVLTLQGGKRGLLVNSGGVCASGRRAGARLGAQSGKRRELGIRVKADCPRGSS